MDGGLMPDGPLANVGELIIWTAAVVGGVVAMFRLAGAYILRPIQDAAAERDAERLDKALAPLAEELRVIRSEVTYNGGASLKDAVRGIDLRLTRMEGRAEERWHADHTPKEG